MSGPEAGRAMRWGGLIFAGAALLAVAAVGLQWKVAPAILRTPLFEVVFLVAGAFLLTVGLASFALESRAAAAKRPVPSADPTPRPNLMTLPAMVGAASAPSGGSPPLETATERTALPASPSGAPTALAAEGPTHSTLLIPFAEGLRAVDATPPVTVPPDQTVSRLVGRMDALQRATPSSPGPSTSPSPRIGPTPGAHAAENQEPGSVASPLLLRLTHIPAPPATASAASVARRCTDCGEPFGSPPQFEPCMECGRALCERCYWRTSSGPQAHLCTPCFRDRSVPRPPGPSVTFPRPGPNASVSTPSGRSPKPRRPAS